MKCLHVSSILELCDPLYFVDLMDIFFKN